MEDFVPCDRLLQKAYYRYVNQHHLVKNSNRREADSWLVIFKLSCDDELQTTDNTSWWSEEDSNPPPLELRC